VPTKEWIYKIMLSETHLYQEIHEQPQVLNRLLQAEQENVQTLAAAIQRKDIQQVIIAARGTSDNAGRYAQYLLGSINGLVVALATPSLFTLYQQPPRLRQSLVLGISQSGQSPDIVAVLAEARQQGALTAAITNMPDSDLARQADHVIGLQAGREQSVAATKTYTSELAAIALLSTSLAGDSQMLTNLQKIPKVVNDVLATNPEVAEITQRYRYMRECVVIGRGYNYATAFELALKLKELTYTFAEPYSSADFLHGPLALIEHGFPAIVIAPSGRPLTEIQNFIRTLKEFRAEIIAISDDADTLALADVPITLPQSIPEWLSPVITIIPGQLFAMHLAHIRNYDPDQPRGLNKVTETV
jgi:glucosamine--fructose-6-phosphate aminotransferase (isomerizing)